MCQKRLRRGFSVSQTLALRPSTIKPMKMRSINKNALLLFTTITLAAFMAPGKSFAQDKKVGFGLQATPALCWLKPDGSKSLSRDGSKVGFGYGLVFDFRFGENYSLSTGMNVVSSKSQIRYLEVDTLGIQYTHGGVEDTLYPPFGVTYSVNYIELPIHLMLKTNEIGYMTYFGQFGLATQIKTKAKGDATGVESWVDREDVGDEVKVFNMGLSIGAGFEYSLGGDTKLLVALVYNNGFSDVLKSNDLVTAKSLGLRLGIMF
ncbi:MAG TPA: PorT family protein [Flavobacteriales bacterium]|nr:PorT family protein [Flavobacteriales bacterium]